MDDEAKAYFYFDWLKHESKIFTDRLYFFIVAEAMLVVAAATIINGGLPSNEYFVFILVCSIGLIVTVLWGYIAVVHLFLTVNPIKKKLREVLPEYANLVERRKRFVSTHLVIGLFLPILLAIAWILIIILVRAK